MLLRFSYLKRSVDYNHMMHYRMPPGELRKTFSDPTNFGGHLFPGPPAIAIPQALKWVSEISQNQPNSSDQTRIICVGDVVSRFFLLNLNDWHSNMKYCFIDGTTQRGEKFAVDSYLPASWQVVEKNNPAGVIEEEIFEFIRSTRDDEVQYLIRINGEEDLLVLPCVVECPDWVILYGQPPLTDAGKSIPAGCVGIYSSDTVRQTFIETLSRFERIS